MFRRSFLRRMTLATTSSLAAIEAAELRTVTYKIQGFSCVTCAVGLDTMLRQQKGVAKSKSTYPDGTVVITVDPALVTEKSLKDFIAEQGFTVASS